MKETALLIIDVQEGFDDPYWGERNNLDAEINISKILKYWREQKRPIFHIQHCSLEEESPLRTDKPGVEFKEEVTPLDGELIIKKNVNSAFIGTQLKENLDKSKIKDLVIVGFTTDHCVSTTTRMAGNFGYNVKLVEDATATFSRKGPDGIHYTANEIHKIHLASLDREFCEVIKTESIIS